MRRKLLIGALAVVGGLLLIVIGLIIWINTGAGERTMGRYVSQKIRDSLKGNLKVRSIEVGGFLRVCVDGVELSDPDGHKALTAERACVSLNPISLRSKRVSVSSLVLEKPWIEIAKVPGTQVTTLQRAIEAKVKSVSAPGGPFEWVIDVDALSLRGGTVTIRPELGQPATFGLEDLEISNASARYAADGGAAALQLAAQLVSPGKLKLGLDLDASLDGTVTAGKVTVKKLRLAAGESRLALAGWWDLARNAGALELRDLQVEPRDLEAVLKKSPIAGAVSGEADLKSDGKTAQLDLRLDGGGGKVKAVATSTLEQKPVWDLQLSVDQVDPGALSLKAPHGEVTGRVSLHGKGRPEFDEHGVQGDLGGVIHVGPARLDRVGPVVADLEAKLLGRYAIVKAFTATALGLAVKAHGAAAYDEISLDLEVVAQNLKEVGKAIGALTRKPALPMAGSARLTARATGSPEAPDAQVHLRAPRFLWSKTVAADVLAVDGVLHGKLETPDGTLEIFAKRLLAGAIDLGAPRIAMDLKWPVAHLGIDAGVKGGSLQLQGDATVDEDADGLDLSNFIVAWPGNELRLARPVNVHFRDELIIEPLNLVSDHGSLRISAQIRPPPGRIDAAVVVTKFELDRLPEFALPKDLGLRGVLDANAVIQGPRAAPEIDLSADLHGAGAKPAGELVVDAHTHAHIHAGILKSDGWVSSDGLLRFDYTAELPVEAIKTQPPNAPVQLDARLAQVDLAKLADAAKLSALQKQKLHGRVDARILASGTLGAPKATLSIEGHDLGTEQIQQVDAKVGLFLEKGKAALDAVVKLSGEQALGMRALAPLEVDKALKDPAYLRGALERSLKAELAITNLELERLVKSGLLPEGSAGKVSLSAHLDGTPAKPQLKLDAAGTEVSVGRLHGLSFQTDLNIADKVKLGAGAQSQGEAVARLEAGASLSGEELLELWARRGDPDAIAPLLDRSVTMTLEIPGLPIARASQLAGRSAVAEGKLTGRVTLLGTPARPRLNGQLTLKDIAAREKRLGQADLYLEADGNGALVHLGIDPPGGGSFLAHAELKADLGARTLLRTGVEGVAEGTVSGQVKAQRLDISFLSGLITNLRRTRGVLDGEVKLSGDIARPVAEGDAHLRGGLFDVVGQGVFEDVGLDATFSPKEIVIDRITGSTGAGTFAAILVASRRPSPESMTGEKFEFTGEVHLGDDESVRDRVRPDGKPWVAHAVPIRQASEQRADIRGELDIFGDYTDNVLTVNAKIPDARIDVVALPDKKLPRLKENPDVVLVHPGEKPHPPGREPEEVEAEEKAIKEATFRLHAHLDLTRLYVKATDFEFPVESSMNFDYDARHPDKPTADGVIHVPSGSFSALGRRFTISDAKIVETGGEIDDPELEIKALFENPQANVTVTISGTAKSPQIDMSSNPPMDQDAIAFFLATGRVQGRATQSGGGVDLSGAATSVLGGLLFGQVRKELTDVLPVDVITIETSAQGVSEASVGKYIGDKVFVGYRQRLVPAPNENTEEGRIEYQFNRTVSAEATIGDRNSDVSVLYTKEF